MNKADIPKLNFSDFYQKPEETAKAFNESTPIVIVNNDCVAVTGDSLLNAFDRLEVTEYSAMSIIMSKSQGEIIPIDEKGLEEIRKGFNLK